MTKLAYLGAWRTGRATVKERGRARNMLGLTHNSGAITKPGDYFVNFKCPAIYSILIRLREFLLLGCSQPLLLFWLWFCFCFGAGLVFVLGPFLVVMFSLLVEMFMKQLGPRRRRTRTMSGWVRNDCKRNFKDAPSCQLSPYLPLCHSFQHLLLLSAGSSWQQKRLESCYAFAWFQTRNITLLWLRLRLWL